MLQLFGKYAGTVHEEGLRRTNPQRQQADAIIASRTKRVDGTVGMVEMALEQLGQRDVVLFMPAADVEA